MKNFSISTYSRLETGVTEHDIVNNNIFLKISSNRARTRRCRRCSHLEGPVETSNILAITQIRHQGYNLPNLREHFSLNSDVSMSTYKRCFRTEQEIPVEIYEGEISCDSLRNKERFSVRSN